MRLAHRLFTAVGLLAAACSDGSESNAPAASSGPSDSAAPSDHLDAADATLAGEVCRNCAPDEEGGESSEFDGFGGADIAFCPVLRERPLALDDERVLPLVALAEGSHELSLHWEKYFLTDALTGFEEDTSLSLEVVAVGARHVEYGFEEPVGYEQSGCNDTEEVQLEVEVRLQAGDGSVQGAVGRWLSSGRSDNSALSTSVLSAQGARVPWSSIQSTIEFGFDGAVDATVDLQLWIDTAGVRGGLSPVLTASNSGGQPPAPPWTPMLGRFPAPDACDGGEELALDATAPIPGGSGLAAADALVTRLSELGSLQAFWAYRPSGDENVIVTETEVSLSVGEPTLLCRHDGEYRLHAELEMATQDGKAQALTPVTWTWWAGGNQSPVRASSFYDRLRWLPAEEFSSRSGITGVDLGNAEFAAPIVDFELHLEADKVMGELSVARWENFREVDNDYSGLFFCRGGEDCTRMLCERRASGQQELLACLCPSGEEAGCDELLEQPRPPPSAN